MVIIKYGSNIRSNLEHKPSSINRLAIINYPIEYTLRLFDKMTKSTKTEYRAPALEKGLDILELLAQQEDPLNKKQISESLNRSVNEIFRMLTVLEERQYQTKPGGSRLSGFFTGRFLCPMKKRPQETKETREPGQSFISLSTCVFLLVPH